MIDRKIAKIKIRRGTDAQRKQVAFEEGELVFTIDHKRVFIGDGTTTGGVVVGNLNTIGASPSPYAINKDLYFDENTCIMYMLSSNVGPDQIVNYARVTPIPDGVTLVYDNGIFSINQNYLNNKNTGFVRLSGDEMVGYLTLHHTPISAMHAANRDYVDLGLSALSSNIGSAFVHISGDKMTGPLTVNSTLSVTGSSEFNGNVNFNDKLIKRFTPIVKNIMLNGGNDTYTISSDDNGAVLYIDSTSICYVAIPNGLTIGFNVLIVKKSTYTLSFKAVNSINGVQLLNVYNYVSMGNQNGVCNMILIDTDKMLISGDLS